MARRKRVEAAGLGAEVDEDEVRLKAARRAFLMADGVRISGDWRGTAGRWWECWHAGRPEGCAALTDHYLQALERLGALDLFERLLPRCRQQARLNTPAARAARRQETT